MGLAGVDDLHRTVLVAHNTGQPVHVMKQEPGALVGGKAARKADRQGIGVQDFFGQCDLGGPAAALLQLGAQAAPGKGHQPLPATFVGSPQFLIGDAGDALPNGEFGRPLYPPRAQVAVIQIGHVMRNPGPRMDAIGNALDGHLMPGHLGPHALPHLA